MTKSEGELGFRNLESSNRAFVAKQGWRILKHLNSLAARILKGCYFKHCSFLEARKNSSASYVWSYLIRGRDLLDIGLRWRVGDGKTIKIYNDRWILRPTEVKILSPSNLDMLFSPIGGWNVDLINNNFLPNKAKSILHIPAALWNNPNSILWHYETSDMVRGLVYVLLLETQKMDDVNLIDWVNSSPHIDSEFGAILMDILKPSDCFQGLLFRHVPKLANKAAKGLANYALGSVEGTVLVGRIS
ncbi:hypothetical protein Dsin_010094 [Dipteronia sinensis]|uniref:RNase H type-1 domain-containing protein n=1 Tax=Dipteronia sinensis TaxID=43782 RepID=A0AAE0AT13_9ROSI|nr:hypothetical protein Dsin_010094 [Dipteronia sinensis]